MHGCVSLPRDTSGQGSIKLQHGESTWVCSFYSNEASPYKARINFPEEAYAARMAELGVPGDWDHRRGKHMVLALCELIKARQGEADLDPNAPPEHEQIPIIPYLGKLA